MLNILWHIITFLVQYNNNNNSLLNLYNEKILWLTVVNLWNVIIELPIVTCLSQYYWQMDHEPTGLA